MTKTRRLKICFISHSAEIGGAELSLLETVDCFNAKGIECKVILPSRGALEEELRGMEILYAVIPYNWWAGKVRRKFGKGNSGAGFKNFVRIYAPIICKIKEWNSDVVYSNTSVINCGAVAALFLNKPHVWHLHEFGYEDHRLNYFWPFKKVAQYINTHSNIVIANSRALARKYRRFIPKGKLMVVGNSVKIRRQILEPVANQTKVDVVVTFKDDPNIMSCLESLVRNITSSLNKVYFVDDKSVAKPLVKSVRSFIRRYPKVFVYKRGKKNRGYIFSVNKGIRMSENDVILLNSDTVVTRHWVEKLKKIAYQDERIATVTPLSNNATIFSVTDKKCRADDAGSVNDILEKIKTDEHVDVPTAHGFCMYIKRKVIDEISAFDFKSYKFGYCEENDFSLKAHEAGYRNVAACGTYVYHKGNQTFGLRRKELLRENYSTLLKRYPQYEMLQSNFIRRDPLEGIRRLLNYFLTHPNLIDERKICIVGSIHPGKGQLDAVRAMEALLKKFRVHLFIVGAKNDKKYYRFIRDYVRRKKIGKFVHFLGALNNPCPVMRLSDIVLMCSEREAFGRVTVEAMLHKKPVVGRRSGGTPELIRNGFNGLLYSAGRMDQLAKKIEVLLGDEELSKKMGENGFVFARKLTKKNQGKIHRCVLKALESGRSKRLSGNAGRTV